MRNEMRFCGAVNIPLIRKSHKHTRQKLSRAIKNIMIIITVDAHFCVFDKSCLGQHANHRKRGLQFMCDECTHYDHLPSVT